MLLRGGVNTWVRSYKGCADYFLIALRGDRSYGRKMHIYSVYMVSLACNQWCGPKFLCIKGIHPFRQPLSNAYFNESLEWWGSRNTLINIGTQMISPRALPMFHRYSTRYLQGFGGVNSLLHHVLLQSTNSIYSTQSPFHLPNSNLNPVVVLQSHQVCAIEDSPNFHNPFHQVKSKAASSEFLSTEKLRANLSSLIKHWNTGLT